MKWYKLEHFICGLCGLIWLEINKGQFIICPRCDNAATHLEPQIEIHWPHLGGKHEVFDTATDK